MLEKAGKAAAAITASAAAAAKKAASAAAEKAAAQEGPRSYQFTWKEKLARYKDELSNGVWGYWELGAWKPLALSARKRAAIRKEVLLAGEVWPYDPPKKEMRNKRKGHKCDRVAAEKCVCFSYLACSVFAGSYCRADEEDARDAVGLQEVLLLKKEQWEFIEDETKIHGVQEKDETNAADILTKGHDNFIFFGTDYQVGNDRSIFSSLRESVKSQSSLVP
ncbi:hypothetical protein IEQ34_001568 [Dendrobium chrysotoxum]|uniref:Uncharacterized protein n=1 Tax=Dendrobium chrysotoxum TaxID=161865 RepID=A0AAV7H786_DENCH|nr:hypothetical protein IEQ34_001568 [Dendrobium chrysotoxum]